MASVYAAKHVQLGRQLVVKVLLGHLARDPEMRERFKREAIAPIQNKVGQLLLSPVIRNIVGQVQSKVSIPFVMNNERIFIANLAKGRIGEQPANLLGSLLVSHLQLVAMGRSELAPEKRVPFFSHIDEFQSFGTEAFASLLSEAH